MKFFIIGIISPICIIVIMITAIPTVYKLFPESEIIENIGVRTGKLEFWDVIEIKIRGDGTGNTPYDYVYVDKNGNHSLLSHFGPIAKIGNIYVGDRIVRTGSKYHVIEGGAQ